MQRREAAVAEQSQRPVLAQLDDEGIAADPLDEARGRHGAEVHHGRVEAGGAHLVEMSAHLVGARHGGEELGSARTAREHGEGGERALKLERHLALELVRHGRRQAARVGEGQVEDPVADRFARDRARGRIGRARAALRHGGSQDRGPVGPGVDRHRPGRDHPGAPPGPLDEREVELASARIHPEGEHRH